jgi:hypothetical protein
MNLWAKTIRAGRTLFEKISLTLFSLSAKQYYKDGKYQPAITDATRAYELAHKLYGDKDHRVGVRLNMLGILLREERWLLLSFLRSLRIRAI